MLVPRWRMRGFEFEHAREERSICFGARGKREQIFGGFIFHRTMEGSAATTARSSARDKQGFLVASNEAHLYNLSSCPPKKRFRLSENEVFVDVTNIHRSGAPKLDRFSAISILPAKKRVQAPQFGQFEQEMGLLLQSHAESASKHKVSNPMHVDAGDNSARDDTPLTRQSCGEEQFSTANQVSGDAIDSKPGGTCSFCQEIGDSKWAGLLMKYENDALIRLPCHSDAMQVHWHCAEWAPNVYFLGDDQVENLDSEVARAQKLRCYACGVKGAALGCFFKRCRKSFHYSCARDIPACRWDDVNFLLFCPEHASCSFPGETKKRTRNKA